MHHNPRAFQILLRCAVHETRPFHALQQSCSPRPPPQQTPPIVASLISLPTSAFQFVALLSRGIHGIPRVVCAQFLHCLDVATPPSCSQHFSTDHITHSPCAYPYRHAQPACCRPVTHVSQRRHNRVSPTLRQRGTVLSKPQHPLQPVSNFASTSGLHSICPPALISSRWSKTLRLSLRLFWYRCPSAVAFDRRIRQYVCRTFDEPPKFSIFGKLVGRTPLAFSARIYVAEAPATALCCSRLRFPDLGPLATRQDLPGRWRLRSSVH